MADNATLQPAFHHQPPSFVTAPGETDVLLVIAAVFLFLSALGIGVLYFRVHALPSQFALQKKQYEIVCALSLIALFTQMYIFWVAALLVALVKFPDLAMPFRRIAGSVQKIADSEPADRIPLKLAEPDKLEPVGYDSSNADGPTVMATQPPEDRPRLHLH